ncbi:putative Nitroreductase family protein [Blattamonas nauphoetae]|uniref:Nitroreductase family protein n=1 Tax=Blattamonas nauphoetae TaxID=2049346 RepID=A0ABQ9YI20_9EUKA|nr:putative Nitroreductase family protein [Blattamonas nauphoetae]
MSFLELAHSRKSCRCFSTKPVPQELVQQIVEAGMIAPTGMNLQPFYFYVLNDLKRNQELFGQIEEPLKTKVPGIVNAPLNEMSQHSTYDAPCSIFCCLTNAQSNTKEFDLGIAVDHMMMAAESLGLKTLPACLPVVAAKEHCEKAIGMEDGQSLFIVLGIGYEHETVKGQAKEKKKNLVKFL